MDIKHLTNLKHSVREWCRRLILRLRSEIKRLYIWLVAHTFHRYPKLKYFIGLSRLNKPVGIYLLLAPTFWALWLAAQGWPGWHLFIVFTLGVVLARSAGCVMNDIADRNFDAMVKRTQDRPLANNKLSMQEALILMGSFLLIALLLVLTTNALTVMLSLIALVIAAIYPFMKRFTYMPQAVLGLAFSWGIPMAFAAHTHEIPQIAWLLLVANLLWTVAYDTEYAMVDRDDDMRLGLKSSAILFGDLDRLMIGILQGAFIITLLMVSRLAELGLFFDAGIIVASGFMLYQQYLIRNRERDACFKAFTNNQWLGLAVFSGLALNYLAS